MKYIDDEGKMCTMAEPPVNTLEERIRRLEDTRKIEECMYHYMHACDDIDPVGMSSCFTENGKLSWGDIYEGHYNSRQEICEKLTAMLGAARTQSHFCTNQQIWFETPDSAIVHCYMYSWQTWKDITRKDTVDYGRYELQVVRDTDGEWRFSSFKLIVAGQQGGPRSEEHFNRPWPPQPIV